MKNFLKNNYKFIIGIVLGILSGSFVYATTISSSNVFYDNSTSGLDATTAENAIKELKTLSKKKTLITAWTYNEDKNASNYCINGEEDTCKKTDCYKSGKTCPIGTVIKYYVNDNLYHYFYVLKDDGTTITMQQRENTIRNIPWHAGSNDNTQGPVTILPALEQATSTWTNVDILEYAPGEDEFLNTGCRYTGEDSGNYKPVCSTTTYSMTMRKARARMITAEETEITGCLIWKDGVQYTNIMGDSINSYNQGSCPDWMHNYLWESSEYGGSYEDNTQDENENHNNGYWTMSAYNAYSAGGSFYVSRGGNLSLYGGTINITNGSRAVVEITKSNL